MSGHGGIQKHGAGKKCAVSLQGSALYRSVYWAEQEYSGLSSLGDSFRQPGASPVVDPQLHENSWLCRAGVGRSSPLALASHREQGRGVCLPVKNHPGLSKPRGVRRESPRQRGALRVPGRN